jgi:hypothetical protein
LLASTAARLEQVSNDNVTASSENGDRDSISPSWEATTFEALNTIGVEHCNVSFLQELKTRRLTSIRSED